MTRYINYSMYLQSGVLLIIVTGGSISASPLFRKKWGIYLIQYEYLFL